MTFWETLKDTNECVFQWLSPAGHVAYAKE